MPNPSKPEVTGGAVKPAAGKTIYVSNPKDARLLAYKDSLRTFSLLKPFKIELDKKLRAAKTLKDYDEASRNLTKKYIDAGLNTSLLFPNGKLILKRQWGDLETNLYDADAKRPTTKVVVKKEEKQAFVKKLTKVNSAPVKKVTEVKPLPVKQVSKVNIAPKELKMPTASIKVQRTVKMPSGIRDIKYDTQKGTVLVNLDGTQKSMPRKEFDTWVNKPENRKMFNEYRTKKANKK